MSEMKAFKDLLARATLPWKAPSLWDASGLTENTVLHAPRPGEHWKGDTAVICSLPPDPRNRANADLLTLAANHVEALVSKQIRSLQLLQAWLDMNECECETSHSCGRPELERHVRDTERLLASIEAAAKGE